MGLSESAYELTTTRLSRPIGKEKYECLLCPLRCRLKNGDRGRCKARVGINGGISPVMFETSSIAIEPIEKKPLFHYKPGLKTLSFGSFGCNFDCDYCQNFSVSQSPPRHSSHKLAGDDLMVLLKEHGAEAMCFTYNEPTIYYEAVMEISESCRSEDIPFIIKTNGYCETEPWADICGAVDAMNIDWKGSDARYRSIAKTDGHTVIKRIEEAVASSSHVEISIPVYSDSFLDEYHDFPKWLSSLDPAIPVHLLRIVPAYKNMAQITSDKLIKKVADTMMDHLHYVYVHGLYGTDDKSRNTTCHLCGMEIIKRDYLSITNNNCDCGIIEL